MKSTKMIDIELCDVCGREKSYFPLTCGKCSKDLCGFCEEMFHVEIKRIKSEPAPHGSGYMSSTSIKHIRTKHNATYCKPCAKPIVEALEAMGLAENPDKDRSLATMDVAS